MKKNNRRPKKKRGRKPYGSPPKAKAKKVLWLNILPADEWIKARQGTTVYDALKKTDLDLEAECGGQGTCGKCKIKVVTALGPPDEQEKTLLTDEELAEGIRLACRTRIRKTLVIHTESPEYEMEFFQILKHGSSPPPEIDPLVDTCRVEVTPPSLDHPESDFHRVRSALGAGYTDLTVTPRCAASLYGELRRSGFRGEALVHRRTLLAWAEAGCDQGRYGIIFDIGTTTLVGKLIDTTDGGEVSVVSLLNSQSRYGTDVVSRIKYVTENRGGLDRMRRLLVRDLNFITHRLLTANEINPEAIFVAVAAGNTTMQHLLLGLNPAGIAEAPFTPVITEGMAFRAHDLGLGIHPDAVLYLMPCKSGYVGGDLIGFILSTGAADETERLVLGLDFGTNGEIFLGNAHRMLTCSTAAGPALEGARISRGMIARTGAIEGVRVDQDEIRYDIIGNVRPRGLCGSGLVDLVAVLLHHGVVDSEGLLTARPVDEYGDLFLSRVVPGRNGEAHDFVIARPGESYDGDRVLLTQNDIRELQFAKGAMAAGVETLMELMGVGVGDLDVIYLAGALGNYVNPYSAMRIGLMPITEPHRIVSVGNAASAGARMVLLSKKQWHKASAIVEHVEHVELSTQPGFHETFISALDFPPRNLW